MQDLTQADARKEHVAHHLIGRQLARADEEVLSCPLLGRRRGVAETRRGDAGDERAAAGTQVRALGVREDELRAFACEAVFGRWRRLARRAGLPGGAVAVVEAAARAVRADAAD